MRKILITDIIIENRHRKDLGDIESLREDIKINGLINPITISENNVLIAGERRITAMALLGEKHIDAHVIELKSTEDGYSLEFAENNQRKEFTLTEKYTMVKVLTPAWGGNKEPRLSPESLGFLTKSERGTALAKAVGLSSNASIGFLSSIVRKGVQELKDAVDSESISLTAGYAVSKLDEVNQLRALSSNKEHGDWELYPLHKVLIDALKEKKIKKDECFLIQKRADNGVSNVKDLLSVRLRELHKISVQMKNVKEDNKRKDAEDKDRPRIYWNGNANEFARDILEMFKEQGVSPKGVTEALLTARKQKGVVSNDKTWGNK